MHTAVFTAQTFEQPDHAELQKDKGLIQGGNAGAMALFCN